jgi:orotate phosphoribosyltransferase-like protein
MATMPAVQREEFTARAVQLSAEGWSAVAIAEDLGIHRKTVKKLIDDEMAQRSEHRAEDKERAIARYEAVIEASWKRYRRVHDASTNASALLNTIVAAQGRIDKITGAESPTKIQHVEDELEVVWPDANGDIAIEAAQTQGTP